MATPFIYSSLMIYSASRRTDLPAFYPDALVRRVDRSRKLEAIVLWTKDIRNLARHAGLARVVRTVPTVVNYTVTGLAGTAWEPRVPPLGVQHDDLAAVARVLPARAICWRFDPIIPTPDWLDRFRTVKRGLESALGPVDSVTVSFPDPYRKAVARTRAAGLEWPVVPPSLRREMISALVAEFDRSREALPVRLCCEPELLDIPGVGQARCIDGGLFQELYGLPLGDVPKDAGQRVHCGCARSTDIGEYANVCGHGCLYCYARPDEGPEADPVR
ncbi:MAG: DUF1848 domain-containing protein [Planctomycetes bacterium]|nr:DUF1848 domain-containing protein [Planctomycetota bacterium]MCD7898232.1 DUF1848 domain-containing protein [Planctomycetaceae bacterium]